MTKISRFPLTGNKLAECINNLWSALTLMSSKEDIRLLCKDLFSHTEVKMFAKRLAIARMLLEGSGYEEIIRELKVTDRTVAHVNNVLAEKGEGLRKAHRELSSVDRQKLDREARIVEKMSRPFRTKLAGQDVLPSLLAAGVRAARSKIKAKQKKNSIAKIFDV